MTENKTDNKMLILDELLEYYISIHECDSDSGIVFIDEPGGTLTADIALIKTKLLGLVAKLDSIKVIVEQ